MSLLLAVAGGPVTITGTLATTETGDTAAFVGLIAHTGTLAVIEGSDTASFVGLINHTGDLVVTEGGDTASFGGNVVVQDQGAGGGSGYPVYGKYVRPKGISEFLDIAMSDIYAEGTKKTAPKELKAKIVKIVKPYKKEDSIDWNAFEKDTIRVQEMIDLWDKQIMEEDELIIMAYMEYFY